MCRFVIKKQRGDLVMKTYDELLKENEELRRKLYSPETRFQDKVDERLKEYGLSNFDNKVRVNGYTYFEMFPCINRLISFKLGVFQKTTEKEYKEAVKLLDEILPPKEDN